MSRFTDYQVMVLITWSAMNLLCGFLVVFTCYALVRYPRFREGLSQAIQNGDNIFHWIDAKSFGFFVAGFLCALFTMNITWIFVYEKMFELGPFGFVGFFTAVTFTLWGIAWKK
jgi:hypothetical protein